MAEVSTQLALLGGDKGYKIGDFDVKAGAGNTNNFAVAAYFTKRANDELAFFGCDTRFNRTY